MDCDLRRQADTDTWVCAACGWRRTWRRPGNPPPRNCGTATPPRASADPTACTHRGQVVRAEPCASCNNSTIEVSVHACPLHTECTLYDYAARNPKLAGVKVCAKCPDRRAEAGGQRPEVGEENKAPPPWKRLKNFGRAILRDLANGRERRSPDLVARIFDTQCAACPLFQRSEVGGQRPGEEEHGRRPSPDLRPPTSGLCTHCGCHVSPRVDELNKLHWQSEKCPLGKWPIERLNLIFYILPLAHTGRVWQWHVEQLRQRLHLFNGRRIVTIATPGPGNLLAIEPAAAVRAAFGSDADSIEFLERPNDPHHWETPAFREMLALLAPTDAETRRHGDTENEDLPASPRLPLSASPSATFYGHAKGVRRARWQSIKLWCEAMYKHNLDRIDEVRELLGGYPCVGVAKIPQRPTAIAGPGWHFAGTYFWVNDQELFSRPGWNQIHDHSHAVEGYLATQFPESDAYCLAYLHPTHVYQASTWLNRELEAREGVGGQRPEVREETAVGRTLTSDPRPPTSVSIIVTARNNGPYLRECLQSCLSQTYAPLEVIYCDDASTDDSVAIARSFEPRVQVVPLVANLGVEEARNLGAQRASGEALLFVDGDNILTPDYLERMVAALTKETPFVYPDLQRFGAVNRLDRMPEFDPVKFREANCADTCSLIWASAFATAGGWRKGFEHLADWHLFLRLSRLGKPARSGAVLLYRDHAESMSAEVKGRLTAAELADLERRVVADALGE